jgi:hypothetical protein
MDTTKFELKYCELCGALGLRRTKTSENYCRSCEALLTQRVVARHSIRRGPSAKRHTEIHHSLPLAAKLVVLQ